MNIYVGNLNYKVRESDLQKVMEDYGAVTAVKFIKDRETGRFRGIAFVEMEDAAAAAKAIEENKTACSLLEKRAGGLCFTTIIIS